MRIPFPTYDEIAIPELVEKVDEFVNWYLNVPPWICSCGLKNFGRNKKCAKCKKEQK